MTTALATTEEKPTDILTIISQMASSPATMNPDVIHKLIDAQERIMAKQGEIEFNQAMANLQPLLPAIKKDTPGHNGKYANYDDIDKIIRPLYTMAGFSLSFTSAKGEKGTTYFGTISHVAGHSKTAEMVLPADDSGKKNPIQAIGSTVSYAKRYLVAMLLNLVFTDEDDDGHRGGLKAVNDQQLSTIRDWIAAVETNEVSICKFMNVECLEDIPESQFERVIVALKAKQKS